MTSSSFKSDALVKARTPAASLEAAVSALTQARTPEEIVDVLRCSARRLVGSDGIAIVLKSGEDCHYVAEDAVGPLWAGTRFPMRSCISGWAMLHRQTVRIHDILVDERIPQDLYRGTFVRSLVIAPIRPAAPVGALCSYWSQTYEAQPEEVETLERLASAAGVAFQRLGQAEAAPSQAPSADSTPSRIRWRRGWIEAMARRRLPFWGGQLLAIGLVACFGATRAALTPLLGGTGIYTMFFPAVLVSALWGGPSASVTAVVLSSAAGLATDLAANPDGSAAAHLAATGFFALTAGLVALVATTVRALLNDALEHAGALERRDADLAALSRELDHRIKNMLTIVDAIALQTSRSSRTPAEMKQKLSDRLHALGRAQALAVGGKAADLMLANLIRSVVQPFGGQVFIDVADHLRPPAGREVTLALALHELATNAVKYGALGHSGGSVRITADEWAGRIQLSWRELGLEQLRRPEVTGTGSRLISNALYGARGGGVATNFLPDGLHCVFSWNSQDLEAKPGSDRRP